MPLALLVLALVAVASPALADPVDGYIKREMASRRIPGLAVAVDRNGAVVKMQGYGIADLEHDVPVTPDTVFELASVTKQFTATAILALVEAGKLKLDDHVLWHLPRGPETWKGMTVRHLLTHTSGLPGIGEGWAALRPGGPRLNDSTAQLFDAARKDALGFAAGERFQYSDVGYFLAGMVIETASGQRYREFLQERFFTPLGMSSTSVVDHSRILKHRAAGYTLRDDQLVDFRRVTQSELPSYGGVFSNVKDLVTWTEALAAGRVVKPTTLAEMWTPTRLNDGSTYPYGLGWFLGPAHASSRVARRHHRHRAGAVRRRRADRGRPRQSRSNDRRDAGQRLGLAHGVAGRYMAGLHLGGETPRPDPDADFTRRLREALDGIGRGEASPLVNPRLVPYFSAQSRDTMRERLATLKSFTFVTCDDVRGRGLERFGLAVDRICHYRLVNAVETRYYSFALAGDGRVTDLLSSTE